MTRGKFNAQRGDVRVNVGEVEIILRYTLRALALMQERVGRERFEEMLGGNRDPLGDIEMLEALIDAGMAYHHGPKAEHGIDVLAEATGADLDALIEGFTKAFSAAFPAKAPAAAEDASAGPPVPASTSTS